MIGEVAKWVAALALTSGVWLMVLGGWWAVAAAILLGAHVGTMIAHPWDWDDS